MKIKRFIFLGFCLLLSLSPLAAQNSAEPPRILVPYLAGSPDIQSRAAVVLDAETGTVLYAKNPDDEIPPASLTKLMTIYIVLEEAAAGNISLDKIIVPPRESWAINQPPRSSLMFLAAGQQLSIREILQGLAVSSGNDAAVAAALTIAPSVTDFAFLMNGKARNMGLTKTRFIEPSGISEKNITTAAEFSRFCRIYIMTHPETLAEFHSVPEFAYPKAENVSESFRDDPHTIVQYNRNKLLKNFPGVDGLKTGYIDEAGYNIALTAERGGSRFIAVILGAPAARNGEAIRDEDGRKLLGWAFDNFKTVRPIIGDIEKARLWKGKKKYAELKIAAVPEFTAPADRANSLWLSTELQDPLSAPLPADYPVGNLVISDAAGELHRIPLLTAKEYERGNIFKRIWDSVILLFRK